MSETRPFADDETIYFPSLSPSVLPEREHIPYWQHTSHRDRSFESYQNDLGLDFTLFTGQHILDLGSGTTAKFAQEAGEYGIRVTSINPNWTLQEYRTSEIGGAAVAGIAEALPFASKTFDFVVSYWGVPVYLPGTAKAYFQAFNSIYRVLKPNSWGLLIPIHAVTADEPMFYKILDATFDTKGYDLLDSKPTPKLLVYKDITHQKRKEINKLKPAIDAARFAVW